MSQDYKVEVVLPDPKRVIEGLRDTGYQFETAMADIIDNSIAADATLVDVRIEMDYDGEINITIADDGHGMNRDELIDAMRYGSKKRPDLSSLGKFGLGLKTASTAFCRRLSVVSKKGKGCPPLRATWDLDHVASVGRWELLLASPSAHETGRLNGIAGEGPGTVVVWEKVDRLLKSYADAGGTHAQKALNKSIQKLKEHASMVYQRFLDPSDTRARNTNIVVNGEALAPYDPFCTGEPSAEKIAGDNVQVELNDGKEAAFSVNAFVLPRKEEFTTADGAKHARLGNENQGIYIYRENRLIHGPDWLGMFRKEPHFTLSRAEFSFDHRLDEAFHIDIKKSQIILNEDLYNWLLNEFLPVPRRAAEQRYRKGQKKKVGDKADGTHDSSNNNIHGKSEDLKTAEVDVINQANNEVNLTNKFGTTRLKIKICEQRKPGEVHIQPVDSVDDGLLWEPAIISGNQGVHINTGHPYYHKVYMPNRQSGVTIQGLDSLVWALGAAEMGTISETTQRHFREMRYEVSRILRALVEDLPEPDVEDDEQ